MVIPDNEKVNKDIQIYNNELEMYADDYISSLLDQNDIKKNRVFTGLIKYLSNKCKFHYDIKIYNDPDYIWNIWNMYTDLVYKYGQLPTVQEFVLLLNINQDTFYSWKQSGKAKDFCKALNCSRAEMLTKIQEECALGRYKNAESGNVGGIFLCKAVDHLIETAPAPIKEINKLESEKLQDSLKAFEAFQIGVKN